MKPTPKRPFPQLDRGDGDLKTPLGLIQAIIAYTDTQEADLPHGVLSSDPETGAKEVWGPYPTAHEALLEAEKMSADFNQPKNNDGPPIAYEVVRLLNPLTGT